MYLLNHLAALPTIQYLICSTPIEFVLSSSGSVTRNKQEGYSYLLLPPSPLKGQSPIEVLRVVKPKGLAASLVEVKQKGCANPSSGIVPRRD